MALQKLVITIICVLLSLLLLHDHHHHTLAASGGRMGGTSFSSSSSISGTRASNSKSTLVRSYSTPTSYSKLSSRGYSTQDNSPIHPKLTYVLGPYDVCKIMTFFAIIYAIYLLLNQYYVDEDAAKTSVLKLQVFLKVSNHHISC